MAMTNHIHSHKQPHFLVPASIPPPKLGFKLHYHHLLPPATKTALLVHYREPKQITKRTKHSSSSSVHNLSPKELTLLLKNQPHWTKTLELFRDLRSRKDAYVPNHIHYNVVLRALGRAHEWDELRLCWIDMAKDGLLPTNNTYAMLIDVYAKAGLRKESLQWLKHMRVRGMSPDEVTMNTVLRILKDSGRFDVGERFYESWCNGEVDSDVIEESVDEDELELRSFSPKHFILTELFRSGGRPSVSKRGSNVVDEGVKKPRLAATYNTLIDMYGKAGKLKEASDKFSEMLKLGVSPDVTTFNTMIHICGTHGNLVEAEALLGKMQERRILPDTKTFNILMTLYAAEGNAERMLIYYRNIRSSGLKPDAVTHRIVLGVLCGKKMVREVEDAIEEMERFNVPVDEQSLPVVVKMYVDVGVHQQGNAFLEQHCFGRDISSNTYAAIIDAYAEKGLWMEAENVFYGSRNPGYRRDTAEYNVMIKAYGKRKLYDKALSLYEGMASTGTWPDECTYNSIIQMLSGGDYLDRATSILAKMQHAGFRPRCETFSAVIACYTRAGMISEALETYAEMRRVGVKPNEVIYGSLINALAESGKVEVAFQCFQTMVESGFSANQIAITSLIKAYSKVGVWQKAQELYGQLKDLGGPDIIASNTMLDLYANLGMPSEAKLIYDDVRQNGLADEISYSTMMHLYKSLGMLNEAIQVAQEMQRAGLLTDCFSFNTVMASYASNGQLRECGELLHQMQVRRILPDTTTFRLIITILKKGGISPRSIAQLEASYIDGKPYARQALITSMFSVLGMHKLALESCESFVRMAGIIRDPSAYNAAIYAYGTSGNMDKALNLLIKMQDDGLEPDTITYINLAGCYGKAGMVEGVKRIYSKLKYLDLESDESLFKAIVDAYKDAGRPDLAEIVNQEMKFSLHAQDVDSNNENEGMGSETEVEEVNYDIGNAEMESETEDFLR